MCSEPGADPAQQTPPRSAQSHRNSAREGLCSVGRSLKLGRGSGSLELGLSGGTCAGGDELFAYQTVATVTEPFHPGPCLLRSVDQRDVSLVLERITFNLCSRVHGFHSCVHKNIWWKGLQALTRSLFSSRALQRGLLSLCSRPLLQSSDSLQLVSLTAPRKPLLRRGRPWSLGGEHQWLIVSPAAFRADDPVPVHRAGCSSRLRLVPPLPSASQ